MPGTGSRESSLKYKIAARAPCVYDPHGSANGKFRKLIHKISGILYTPYVRS